MSKQKEKSSQLGENTLGIYLANIRATKRMTLRDVEDASGEVSNAYLSQLEKGHIKKPSPNILHSLASVYGIPYEVLMEKAGYITAVTDRLSSEKHGRIATFAGENLSPEEEDELLNYLAFLRSRKAKNG